MCVARRTCVGTNSGGYWRRRCALFCLAYPVFTSRGMDLKNLRERKLIEMMSERFDRAVRELSLAELM